MRRATIVITGILCTSLMIGACGDDSDVESPPPVSNPNTNEPGFGNPDTGNPDTGNPDTGNPDTVNPITSDCGIPAQNQWVDSNMRDYYYFYDQVPVVNLADYDSPEKLIRALRFEEKDPFSYVTDLSSYQALFNEGTSFGFGFGLMRDSNNLVRLSYVYKDSPFGRTGAKRSDIVVSVNGIAWDDLTESQFVEMIGTQEQPNEVTFLLQDSKTGNQNQHIVKMEQYKINTVLSANTITRTSSTPNASADNMVIGYLAFKSFLNTSAEELEQSMQFFRDKNVNELVLDLRYNGGGRVSIARKLASQIAGPLTDGQLLTRYELNDKYTAQNFEYIFESEINNLNLSRLVVITTDNTASSSEIVINALKPFIEVITIGSRSRGKPYISASREFCEKSMNAIEAEGFNADGVSVFGGIPADCASVDNPIYDFGVMGDASLDEIDSMLADSIRYLFNGTCKPPGTTIAAQRSSASVIKLPFDWSGEGAIR